MFRSLENLVSSATNMHGVWQKVQGRCFLIFDFQREPGLLQILFRYSEPFNEHKQFQLRG